MKQTENYGLPIYEKTDKMNITGEKDSFNAGMYKIDEVLKKKTNNDDIKALTNSEIESLLEKQV
mgnify:CR=1 FL=1